MSEMKIIQGGQTKEPLGELRQYNINARLTKEDIAREKELGSFDEIIIPLGNMFDKAEVFVNGSPVKQEDMKKEDWIAKMIRACSDVNKGESGFTVGEDLKKGDEVTFNFDTLTIMKI